MSRASEKRSPDLKVVTDTITASRYGNYLDPGEVPAMDSSYPLSAMQQGMLVESVMSPGSGVNIEQLIINCASLERETTRRTSATLGRLDVQ